MAGCFRCGGAWLDNRAAQWIVNVKHTPAMKAFVAALPASSGAPVDRGYRDAGYRGKRCPVCEVELASKLLQTPGITVDVCEADGTYFDALELLRIFRGREKAEEWAEQAQVHAPSPAQQDGLIAEMALAILFGPPQRYR